MSYLLENSNSLKTFHETVPLVIIKAIPANLISFKEMILCSMDGHDFTCNKDLWGNHKYY